MEPNLAKVDWLEFVILVDNSIEWMSKMPPGYTSEVLGHLRNQPPIDPKLQVPILDLDNYCCGAHGLAVLLRTHRDGQTYHTLFDTGPEGKSIARNLDSLKLDIRNVTRIVLSHWHRDHSGGILEVLKQTGGKAGRFDSANYCRPSSESVIARLPDDPTFEEIQECKGVVERHADAHTVQGDTVFVSGEIPRVAEWEKGLLGGMRWIQDAWKPEPDILDERYVAVDVVGKGIIVFSACSHAGICNVVLDVKKRFKDRPIHAVVGGLHLAGPELAQRIAPTVKFLRENTGSSSVVLPLHCTGLAAKVALANAFGEFCVPAGVGIQVRIPAA
ncbi:SubName: Full=Uncharacterized protein {ECO:0000313/EMBL:CCA68653.1} [Serendipita indica DSM 11827]|nr:SubName: Full=Uncharacterized protein {ECO:0000313/EMBL:CCA68653.1} [Serendipita indica DSM 11827]